MRIRQAEHHWQLIDNYLAKIAQLYASIFIPDCGENTEQLGISHTGIKGDEIVTDVQPSFIGKKIDKLSTADKSL